MAPKIKKGTRLRYTGSYAPGVTGRYGVGEVVGFRTARHLPLGSSSNKLAIVRLIEETDELYADFPLDQVVIVG